MADIAGVGIGAIAAALERFSWPPADGSLVFIPVDTREHRCIGPHGTEYVRMGDRWEVRTEAEQDQAALQRGFGGMEMRPAHELPRGERVAERPLSDERLIALYKERALEALRLYAQLVERGYMVSGVDTVWKKV